MKAIKRLWLPIVAGLVLGGSACGKDRDTVESQKPVDVDVSVDKDRGRASIDIDKNDEVIERDRAELRARLSRLDERIDALRSRGSEEAAKAADSLRVRRDELAARLDHAGDETSSRWDTFKKDASDAFDKLEHDVDDALD
jgi:uncharacterized coiled-coil DUF342 family protein